MKNKTLIFTVLTIFVLIVIVVFNAARFNEWNQGITRINQTQLDFCLNEQNITEENKEACELIIEQGVEDIGFYYAFSDIQINTFSNVIYLIPFVITGIALITPVEELKLKTKKQKNKVSIKRFIPVIILPIVSIVVMTISYFFESSFVINSALGWDQAILSNPIIFISGYLLSITLYSLIFVLIALIVLKKANNYLQAYIISSLSIVVLQMFFEFVLSWIISLIFKSDFGLVFNLFNFIHFTDYYGIVVNLIVPITFVLGLFSLLTYINKKV